MQLPLQVSFRHMEHSEAIEARIRARAAQLGTLADRITSCRVVVEPKGKHHRHGNLYEVRIDIHVPGGELTVTREADGHAEYRDLYVALRDAFDTACRQLQDHMRRRRDRVRSNGVAPRPGGPLAS